MAGALAALQSLFFSCCGYAAAREKKILGRPGAHTQWVLGVSLNPSILQYQNAAGNP
jgi:hypothetical protein